MKVGIRCEEAMANGQIDKYAQNPDLFLTLLALTLRIFLASLLQTSKKGSKGKPYGRPTAVQFHIPTVCNFGCIIPKRPSSFVSTTATKVEDI